MPCYRTGYDRLRQAQHTQASNVDALNEKKFEVIRTWISRRRFKLTTCRIFAGKLEINHDAVQPDLMVVT